MKKMIEINLQDTKGLDECIKYNKENNYEFILHLDSDNRLLDVECLKKLLQNGYEITGYYSNLEFIHKYYKKTEE